MFELADELEQQLGSAQCCRCWRPRVKTRPVFWHFVAVAEGALVRARGRRRWSCSSTASRGRWSSTAAVTAGRGRRSRGASCPAALAGGLRLLLSHAHDRAAATASPACAHARDLLRLPDAVRGHGRARLRHRLHRRRCSAGATSTATSTSSTRRSLNVLGTALIAGLLVMMVRRALRAGASSTTRARTARPAIRSSTAARYRDRRLGVRRHAAGDRADRLPARGRADRDVDARLRRHPVRRLDHRPGARPASVRAGAGRRSATGSGGSTACSRSRSSPASRTRRRRTCSRATLSLSLRDPLAGKRLRADRARARGRARRLRRRWPTSAALHLLAARRLHEVRTLPRGLPGERDRPAAVAARRDPRAARAVQPRVRGASGSAACSGRCVDGARRRRRLSARR